MFVISVPAISTVPFVGESNPPITLSRVVFPEPEGPTIAVNSPSSIFRVTPFKAFTVNPPSV